MASSISGNLDKYFDLDGKKFLIPPIIGKAVSANTFIRDRFCYAPGGFESQQMQAASQIYGNTVHNVKGDGNCAVNCMAGSLTYILTKNPGKADLIRDLVHRLPAEVKSRNSSKIRTTLEILDQFQAKGRIEDRQQYKDQILADDSVTADFAFVIRQLGAYLGPEVVSDEQRAIFLDPEFLSAQDGVYISADAFFVFSRLFQEPINCVVLDRGSLNYDTHCYPQNNLTPEIVIIKHSKHFLFIVPDKQKMQRAGIANEKPVYPLLKRAQPNRFEGVEEKVSIRQRTSRKAPSPSLKNRVQPTTASSIITVVKPALITTLGIIAMIAIGKFFGF